MRVSIVCLVVSLSSPQLRAQDGMWMSWDSSRKLIWEDFQGTVADTEYKAETHWRIYYDFQVSLLNKMPLLSGYTVRTEFRKDKSWVKEVGGSDQLLRHEQGHFDLAEVYARKFRAQLDTLSFSTSNYRMEIDSLFEIILAQCDDEQNIYDVETGHGLKVTIQEDWLEIIQKELNTLEDFSFSE